MKTLIISIFILGIMTVPAIGDDYEFPSQLMTVGGTMHRLGKHTDTLIGRHYFGPYLEEIKVTWKYRPSSEHNFKNLIHRLSVSYRVIDAWAPTQEWMYVVGVNDRGQTIVEKWKFTHLDIIWFQPVGGGDPDFRKPVPRVRRTELYNGFDLTHITSILGDPQRRYLLLFGWENKFIYRMNVNDGTYQYLFGPSENPDILNHRRLSLRHHINDGYIYLLIPYPKGISSFGPNVLLTKPDGPNGEDVTYTCTDTVIFRDANKDGIIEMDSLESMTKEQWYDAGYCFPSNFSSDP